MKSRLFIILAALFFACSNEVKEEKAPEKTLFSVVDPSYSKINFTNTLTQTKALNILDYLYYYNGGGVAIGDINNDNLPDIYFTGNQVKNKLFLNLGNMKFKDITKTAGVAGNSDWNTGVTMADVNGDGLLDIYVCAVTGINGLDGKNELFINQGNNTFTEEAEKYGLNIKNYASTAAFFDYDNDGDLDLFLLNHAVHTVNSYGPASIRNKRVENSGDKLMRNDNGKFVDVSEAAGIYGGANGYGLGLATADFNNDGYTDIYVSNDFHEDDYYYINNGDGTFKELGKEKLGHMSRFSMGSDVADINKDGFLDILTLDMLPKKEKVLKASVGDDPIDIHNMKIERFGYHYQYSRNMLQLNKKGEYFQEVALFSGLAATDWSWGALFADYDQDGNQDVFISTGIPKRPNDLDYIKFVSDEHIQKKINATRLVDDKALEMMPSGKVHNFIFQGSDSLKFKDKSGQWIPKKANISTGASYADLDNDGDLDIVTNNINQVATIYKNNLDTASYLKIKFNYPTPNTFGIGTKVIAYNKGEMQTKQLYTVHGFQSSSQPIIHFGFGQAKKVDSLLIIWPDFSFQKKYNVPVNKTWSLSPVNNRDTIDYAALYKNKKAWFKKVDSLPGISYVHQENRYLDFNRQKLIPYRISDRGPAVAVGDLNGDKKEDIFFGNSRSYPAEIYYQTATGFQSAKLPKIARDSIIESVAVAIKDFNNDNRNDIFVVSGGGEFYGKSKALLDKLYLNGINQDFKNQNLPSYFSNGTVVAAQDFNKDGRVDVFVGSGAVSNNFGDISDSYLLINNKNGFSIAKNDALSEIGMVTDAVWDDFNNDGWTDLIVVGEWMTPHFFKNEAGHLKNVTSALLSKNLNGLWQSIVPFDINKDGKMDYLIGNWGLNTKFKASQKFPLKMYFDDFDGNGSTETILAQAKNRKYYTFLGLDALKGQLTYLRKKFTTYHAFAGKTVAEVFGKETLNESRKYEITTLASGYLLNTNGKFIFKPFKAALQLAPITEFLKADFNEDGKKEVLVGGNYFGVIPYHGRFDAMAGIILQEEGKVLEGYKIGLNFTQKAVVGLNMINFMDQEYLLVTYNNAPPEFYKINSK